jgi:hypothetical protein
MPEVHCGVMKGCSTNRQAANIYPLCEVAVDLVSENRAVPPESP